MNGLIEDLRYGARSLLKRRGFTAAAVLTIALAIGANTALFSVANSLLLRELPVRDIDRLVFSFALREGFDPFDTSLLEYSEYSRRSRSFDSMGLASYRQFNLAGRGEPERVEAAAVFSNYLSTLGVEPALGRAFNIEEDRPGGPNVALIGYRLWQRRFGGDPSILGEPITLGESRHTVIGILPQGFDMPIRAEVWVPLALDIDSLPLPQRTARQSFVVARLKEGVTIEQADAELKAIAADNAIRYPDSNRNWSVKLVALRQQVLGDLEGRLRPTILTLLGAVAFLLLIGCANVANLLLAHAISREKEVALRRALGASRWRVMRQSLIESLLLAMAGGVAGLLIAVWVTPLLVRFSPVRAIAFSSLLNNVRIDTTVLFFTLLVSIVTGLVFGVAPAFRLSRTDNLFPLLKEGGRRAGQSLAGKRLLGTLVVCEIAIASVLLAGAGLMIKSFERLQRIDLGFDPSRLLTAQMSLSSARYPDHDRRAAFVEQSLERIRNLPGVTGSGITTNIPLTPNTVDAMYTVEGKPLTNLSEVPMTAHRVVSPGYLEMMGMTLISGRLLNEQDRVGSLPVVVVTQEFARRAWPGEEAVGRRVRPGNPPNPNLPWLTVVGVVKDVKEDLANFRNDRPVWYLSYYQYPTSLPLNFILRTNGDPESLAPMLRSAIREIDGDQPLAAVRSMEGHLAGVLGAERFGALLMGMFAFLGLLLAAIGLFGVMSYSVSQRTSEIGVRIAMGARPLDIFGLVVGQGFVMTVLGLGAGLAGALLFARSVSSLLYEVSPTDPLTFAGISIVLAVSALAASYLPARRASRIDPIEALRHE
ncbi:MAG TPA: ABC transporter permease [Blastocatellia bacterium]|nr:ABC transporter permease [Blastocatellia bacterium]